MMAACKYLGGFAACLAVGMVLSLITTAVVVVMEIPNGLLADSRDPLDVRRMIVGAIAFAIACAVVRFARGRASVVPGNTPSRT
jgi:hypothetical protein